MSGLLSLLLLSLFIFGAACSVFDTETISAPVATAKSKAMIDRQGSYVDPKLIGYDYKIDSVYELTDCAPDNPSNLPERCKGIYSRSFGVVSRSKAGIFVSQLITQYSNASNILDRLNRQLEVLEDSTKAGEFNRITEWKGKALPTTGLTYKTVDDTGGEERIHLLVVKGSYIVRIVVWGYKGPESSGQLDNATLLGWRVMDMLVARVPDKLGGPIPNADSWDNKYWRIQD